MSNHEDRTISPNLSLGLGLIDIEIGLQSIKIHTELRLLNEQIIVEVSQQSHFQVVHLGLRNATDLGVVLVLIKEIIGEFGSHHHSTNQKPIFNA